jgi:hypothetical protein
MRSGSALGDSRIGGARWVDPRLTPVYNRGGLGLPLMMQGGQRVSTIDGAFERAR